MKVHHPNCAGLDVHKDLIVACRRVQTDGGETSEVENFGATTRELLRLSEWLAETGTTHVGMESTGVYWRPVWNILEDHFTLSLVNPEHIKKVKGKKSDKKDAEWIADLLAHGLLPDSFIPDKPIQIVRDLTRTHKQLTRQRSQHTQRIQKILQTCNIKLDSVLSEITGVSGRKILARLISGESDPEKLASLVDRRAKKPRAAFVEALLGKVGDTDRGLIRIHLSLIDSINEHLLTIEAAIDEALRPFAEAVALLETIPGISTGNARTVIAEIGVDMSRFQTAAHLVSWCGLCPRLDESAGKKRSTKLRKGNKWMKTALCQAAWAAVRAKNAGYLRAQFHRIRARSGKRKALMAVAASILTAIHAILTKREPYRDLGSDYFLKFNKQRSAERLTRQLAQLGYQVELRPAA
jgi:transposase